MPVNKSVYFPRQYLRAASSVADAVDSARLRFVELGAVAVFAPAVDCLRLSVPNCGDADAALAFAEGTLARRGCAPVAPVFSFSSSSSESDDIAAMRRLFGRCGESVSCEHVACLRG